MIVSVNDTNKVWYYIYKDIEIANVDVTDKVEQKSGAKMAKLYVYDQCLNL